MDWFNIAAVFVSVCALMLTFYGSVLARRSFREKTYQGFIATWFDLGEVFIAHPELRPYFYDGQPLGAEDENRDRVMAVAEYFDDCFVYAESQAKIIPEHLRRSYLRYKEEIQSTDAFTKYKECHGWVNSRS